MLAARHLDPATVQSTIVDVNVRLRQLFPACQLEEMSHWQPDVHLRAYLAGKVLGSDGRAKKAQFWGHYCRLSDHVGSWLATLPARQQATYRRFALPPPTQRYDLAKLAGGMDVKRAQRQVRKAETDAVVPHYAELRAAAHLRFNRLTRLRQAWHEVLAGARRRGDGFPATFSYEEGAPLAERLHFRVWDRRSFVLAHQERYGAKTLRAAHRGEAGFCDENNTPFLEFLGGEGLAGEGPPEGLWFEGLLRRKVLGGRAGEGPAEEVRARQAWLRAWGHGDDEEPNAMIAPFAGGVAGLPTWAAADRTFVARAERYASGVLVPVEPLYAAACLGLLAVNLFTTTGMRLNEAMQVRLSADCFARLVQPAPPGARDPSPRVRYLFRLIPKGERRDLPQDYFIGTETMRILPKVAHVVAEHYGLRAGEPLPQVPFDPGHGRAHRFAPARYLFQLSHRHVPAQGISASMRFLLHGMVLHTREGQPVVLKPHLLRHAFATHAVQVEKIPLDVVGAWLKQKNLAVTDYYSQPTVGMVAAAADQYLSRVAAHIDVERAVLRSPAELRQLYEEARGRAGTLASVLDGRVRIRFADPEALDQLAAGRARSAVRRPPPTVSDPSATFDLPTTQGHRSPGFLIPSRGQPT